MSNIALIGFGEVGKSFIKLLQIKKDLLPKNTKLKYVIKRDGGIYNKDGLDIDEIIKYTSSNNKIQNHTLWSDISFKDILKNKDVDILIELTSTNIKFVVPFKTPIISVTCAPNTSLVPTFILGSAPPVVHPIFNSTLFFTAKFLRLL